MPDACACERCAGPTDFVVELAPIEGQPGRSIYHCTACLRFTSAWNREPQAPHDK